MKISNIELGQALRDVRIDRGISQNQLAAKLHIPRTVISKHENGYTGIHLNCLLHILEGLNAKPSRFFKYIEHLQEKANENQVDAIAIDNNPAALTDSEGNIAIAS